MTPSGGTRADTTECVSCGSRISADATFCPECGAEQTAETPKAGGNDSEPVSTECANCGVPIDEGVSFCPECGANQAEARRAPARNDVASRPGGGPPTGGTPTQTDRSGTNLATWPNWHYVAALGFVIVVIGGVAVDPSMILLGYVVVFVAVYYDVKYVRSVAEGQPDAVGYLAGSMLLMLPVLPYYLYRRQNEL